VCYVIYSSPPESLLGIHNIFFGIDLSYQNPVFLYQLWLVGERVEHNLPISLLDLYHSSRLQPHTLSDILWDQYTTGSVYLNLSVHSTYSTPRFS